MNKLTNQEVELKNVFEQMNKYMYLYKVREDIVFPNGFRIDNTYVSTTIFMYENNHPEIERSLKNSKSFLQKIKKYDTIAIADKQYILFHSYKLLMFIHTYMHLFDIYMDGSYKKHTFAYFRGDREKYFDKYKKHSNNLLEIDCIDKGQDSLLKFIYFNFSQHHDIMDAYINQCTLTPLQQIKDTDNSSHAIKVIKNLVKLLGSTNFDSYKPIYKSLGIILVSYLVYRMKMKNHEAVSAVNTLFDDLFYLHTNERYQIRVSANEFLKNIYITGRLDTIPIFASSRSEYYSPQTLNGLEKIYNKSQVKLGIDLNMFDYKKYNPLNNLVSTYLNITPMELLQPYM